MTDKRLLEKGKKTREKILEFILLFIEARKFPPTIREILEASRLKSESTIEHHLYMLEREGKIERDKKISRGIRIPSKTRDLYILEYKCLYPFGCKTSAKLPGDCPLHGTELVLFVTRKRK